MQYPLVYKKKDSAPGNVRGEKNVKMKLPESTGKKKDVCVFIPTNNLERLDFSLDLGRLLEKK